MPKLTNIELSNDLQQVAGVVESIQNIHPNAVKLKLDAHELSTSMVMNSILAAQILGMEMETKSQLTATLKINNMKILNALWKKYRNFAHDIDKSEWEFNEKLHNRVNSIIKIYNSSRADVGELVLKDALSHLEKHRDDDDGLKLIRRS